MSVIPYSPSIREAQASVPLGTTVLNYFLKKPSMNSQDLPSSFPAQVYEFMFNLPARSQSDISTTMEHLLGPPTIEGALRYIYIGVYMCSNDLDWWGGVDKLSKWMIEQFHGALLDQYSLSIFARCKLSLSNFSPRQ